MLHTLRSIAVDVGRRCLRRQRRVAISLIVAGRLLRHANMLMIDDLWMPLVDDVFGVVKR